MTTKIAWTDEVWNPTVGCSRVSAGCENCYAERVAHRGMTESHRGLTVAGPKGVRWTGEVRCLPERLETPLHWRKPRRVFVDSMSDLFHPKIPFEFIDMVYATMAVTPEHTYQILTKRPERALEWYGREWTSTVRCLAIEKEGSWVHVDPKHSIRWPLSNVHLGVSIENQDAIHRLGTLSQIEANVLPWISAEPLIGPLDFGPMLSEWNIRWVVVGGESGPGARPCDLDWIKSIVDQCEKWCIPVFVKQLGANPRLYDGGRFFTTSKKGDKVSEWPGFYRRQEFPI